MNAPETRIIERPQFGQYLTGEGGIFVGVMKGENGAPDYLLVLHEQRSAPAPWDTQMKWAKSLKADNHQDFRLPTRREQHALMANAKDQFDGYYYWSCEQHASSASYAWLTYFDDGYQDNSRKDFSLRARAVRSVILQ